MDISYFLNQREGVKYEEIGKKPLAGSFQRRVSALTTHEEPLGAFKPLPPRQIPDPGNQKVGLGGGGVSAYSKLLRWPQAHGREARVLPPGALWVFR